MESCKIAIYTCNFGNYRNELRNIDKCCFDDNISYYLFTDNKTITSKKWNIIYYEPPPSDDIMTGGRWASKYIKFILPDILKEYDIVYWVDTKRMPIKVKANDIIKLFNENTSIRIFNIKHNARSTIQEEIHKTLQLGCENKQNVLTFLEKIKDFKSSFLLPDTCIFVRKTDTETNNAFAHVYTLLKTHGLKRDQNIYNYAFHDINYPEEYIKVVNKL